MKCKNCGAELMDGIMFCPECGERNEVNVQEEIKESVPEEAVSSVENAADGGVAAEAAKIFCPQCGTENTEDTLFCGKCGFSFHGGDTTVQEKKKPRKKNVLLGIGAAVIIAVVGLGGFFLSSGSMGNSKNDVSELFYLKDNQINILSGKSAITVEDDFADDSGSVGLSTRFFPIQFSEDGKYLFYPSDYNGSSYDLYRKKAHAKKDEGIKLDSDVRSYALISSNKIVYIKSSDNRLYVSDLKDKEKVASDVSWFRLSGDNKYILWYTYDSKMYIQDVDLKKDKIKVDSDVSSSYYESDDLKTLIYMKDGNLYCVKNYEDKERIASDVNYVRTFMNGDNLKLYYEKTGESTTLSVGDVVNDDLAASDALMKEPDITNYQTTKVVDSWWGPMEKTETDDKYYEDMEKYNEKLARDAVREYLEQEMSVECEDIYYYDVKTNTSELVFSNPVDTGTSYSDGIGVVQYYDLDKIVKIDMSSLMELNSMELEERVQDSLRGSNRTCLINGKTKLDLDVDNSEYGGLASIRFCGTDDMLYLLYSNKNGDDKTLLSTNVSKDNGKLKEISDEAYYIEDVNENGVYYVVSKDNNGEGSLYCNDKEICEEAVSGTVNYIGNGQLMYFSSMRNSEGTLMMYNKGNEKEIADEIADYLVLDDGKIALLADYNFKKNRGDLKLYSNGKIKDIDTDVTCILRY